MRLDQYVGVLATPTLPLRRFCRRLPDDSSSYLKKCLAVRLFSAGNVSHSDHLQETLKALQR